MARVAGARTGVFDDLASQLRFVPRATLLRQITRAERLGGEIDADGAYPEDWLIQRITGYRPEMDDPALVIGRAILIDLSAFVELLCERAELHEREMADDTLGVEALCDRWGVSRRTIERYRRRGLVARRVRSPDRGGTRLVFTPDAVRAFEARIGGALDESAAFSRLDDRERAMIERRITRYMDRLGWARSRATARLAARMGRSPATVMRVFRASRGMDTMRGAADASALLDAWRDGAPIGDLCARFDRSRSAVHHAIHTERVRRVRRVDLHAPGVRADDAALAHPAARTGLMAERWDDARGFAEFARSLSPVSREAESARAGAMAYLRWRAARMIEGLGGGRAASATIDRIETDLRWIARLVVVLVRDESALILRTIEERAGCAFLDMTPGDAVAWFDAAFGASCDAALRFDPSRGGRLAAPVTIALSHALSGMSVTRVDPSRARAVSRLADWTARACAWQRWLEPGERALRVMAGGDEAARLLRARYGLDGSMPRTAEEMEREFGVSASALARMERG